MTEAERIELFRSYSQFCHYPPALTDAICDYLAGQGSLEQVEQHWQFGLYSIFMSRPSLLGAWKFGAHPSAAQGLDALDCRLLDICKATEQVWNCLQDVHNPATLQQALEYLLTQGMAPPVLLQGATRILHAAFNPFGKLTPLGEALLTLLPAHQDALFDASLHAPALWPEHRGQAPWLVRLLLAAEPPALDTAQQVTEALAAVDENPNVDALGQCAILLLKAAPDRFTPWVCQVAGPDSRASMSSRLLAAKTLLEHNPAAHYDLAMGVLRDTMKAQGWNMYTLRRDMVELLFQFDSLRTLPLLTELVLALQSWETWRMQQLLAQAPFDQARPHLQRCVAEGGIAGASQALKTLLSQQWEGHQEYAVSLLAHRYKRIRKEAIVWLAQQGEAVIDGITPFLTHTDPAIRLSAIAALAALGGKHALAILAARLHQEKTPKVRQAIFEVVGLPASQQHPGPLSQAALIARAEATLQYVHKPTPRWFVATEVPAPLWADNEPVPPAVLRYLLYRQSFVQAPATLDNEVSQALTLLNRSTTGSLATYLFKGWIAQGSNPKEAWCLPLICALGEDTLIPALALRVEDWCRDNRRKLAIRIIQALPLFGRQAAIQELRSLAKRLRRGIVKTAAKATLAAVAP